MRLEIEKRQHQHHQQQQQHQQWQNQQRAKWLATTSASTNGFSGTSGVATGNLPFFEGGGREASALAVADLNKFSTTVEVKVCLLIEVNIFLRILGILFSKRIELACLSLFHICICIIFISVILNTKVFVQLF